MFKRVLIANRGEIAVRILASCQELGIRAIAVYSEADRDALHVRLADEAYCIGPAPARESYLNSAAIIAAARRSGAEAIHPGYGFLSENADFAEACEAADIVFVGPPAGAIRLMGSKTAAKRAVEAAGVPTVPGYAGDAQDVRTLKREAGRIGYSVMIKAAAGGGGKGMRVVHKPEEFEEAVAAAQREALAAFGDGGVFLEKLVVAPRHVEFQILADQHGNVVHLGERDCSIQRRHQKVVEESPSVALTPEVRVAMGEAAVRAARAAGYVNAGTCEFLLDSDGRYYFLEMNTRLQVEHPVTELVTGLDLVHLQLAIAAGERLPLRQEDITPRGHAIEVRLYAEDPANGYLPSTGKVLAFAPPCAPGVRVDTGVAAGDEVSVHYDPMLAKLIVYGEDRPTAVARLGWALDRCAVLGVASNIPLLRAIAREEDFAAGNTTTAYLETHDLTEATAHHQAPAEALVAAALWETLGAASDTTTSSGRPYNPWTRGATPRGAGGERRFRYAGSGGEHLVLLRPTGEDSAYRVQVDSVAYPDDGAAVSGGVGQDGAITLRATDSQQWRCYVARRDYGLLVFYQGHAYTLAKPRPLDVDAATHSGETGSVAQVLVAPMAGTVVKVNVAEGDQVEGQQTLVVLGAMKMEHAVVAPYAGLVRRVPHRAGDVVPGGEVLVELEASAGP
ncbi:MAG TPA: acetyl-CoA carboxylase biotin carboxylase subunit [Ktedonobacterales bacterium]|jgi:3-methylcrotonyl-CoA carboxylase alpha subunit|nr:acetyl-CoA carboxylase biotin carboxylase subunit [Ktedonobacterales bacterium]